MIRNSVKIGLLGKRMVKRSVKDRNLGNVFTEEFPCRPNALNVVWIVERSKIDAVLNAFQDPIVNQCKLRKHLTAMHTRCPTANYKAAIFETETTKMPLRIEETRRALALRSRELFASPNYDGETDDIEKTLYALEALEDCLRLNTKDRRRGPRVA